MPNWNTGRMINAGGQQPAGARTAPPNYSNVAQAMAGSPNFGSSPGASLYANKVAGAQAAGGTYGQSQDEFMKQYNAGQSMFSQASTSGNGPQMGGQAAPASGGYPWYTQNFGSGITMPQGGASSQAIASFANLAPQGGGGTAPYDSSGPVPVGRQPQHGGGAPPPGSQPPLVQGPMHIPTGGQQNASWWNAVNSAAMPAGSYSNEHISTDDWVKNMNATQQYAAGKGLGADDQNSMLSMLDTTSLNKFGADPAANYEQYIKYRQGADAAAAAQQAAGTSGWLTGHPGG